MSMLGTRTKKVTTYGRKQTRIINVHSDFSPSKPTALASKDDSTTSTPVKATRRPLQSKDHTNLLNTPATPSMKPIKVAKAKKVEQASRSPGSHCREQGASPAVRQHARRSRKVVKRTPLNSPQANKTQATPVYRGMYGLPRVMPAPLMLRGESRIEVEIITKLRKVQLNDRAKPQQEEAGPSKPSHPDTTRLLSTCTVKGILPFEDAFTHANFLELLPGADPHTTRPVVRKLGEASYSEVFSVSAEENSTQVVVKVIPLLGSTQPHSKLEAEMELPDCSEVADVAREIEITKRMSRVPGGGFVDFLGAFVVEGQYPQQLLTEWDLHRTEHGTESIRPDVFTQSQRYALVVLANGGTDLESYQFEMTKGWVQAAAVFWQVADALARAEDWTQFEHRDLHEGQILIHPVDSEPPSTIDNYLDPHTTGVQTTLIDFGLSRLDMDSGTASTPPPDEVFEGVGDQWDVYRAMRDRVVIADNDKAWTSFHPITNALWLQYLVGRLLRSTRTLRKPYARRSGSTAKPVAATKAHAAKARSEEAWAMLSAVDSAFASALSPKRSTRAQPARDLTSARAIVAWGREEGWVL